MTDRILMLVLYISIAPFCAVIVGCLTLSGRYATYTMLAMTIVAAIMIVRGRLPRWFVAMMGGD